MDNDKTPEPVAFAKPGDVDCLAFEDGHSWPSIYRHETDTHSLPLYSAETVDALHAEVERLRASIGAIHCMAGRVDASVIRNECGHAVPALAAMKEQGR